VLWIGCSDSRVPGNESIGFMPGEVFYHRNIANQLQMVDFNGLAVLQYAVDWLRVRHIIVCGHYGCGGVKTALKQNELGLLNNWLHDVGELSLRHKVELDAMSDRQHRVDALCELNVIEQVRNVCRSPILLQAWRRGQDVSVHGPGPYTGEVSAAVLAELGCRFVMAGHPERRTLFGDRPYAEVLIARREGTPVGFALFFHSYSTFLAQPGIYLEDIFVLPEHRGVGAGKALLRRVAQIARERNCGRLEWSVLDWNQPAIEFYLRVGATVTPDWRFCRMGADEIAKFADES